MKKPANEKLEQSWIFALCMRCRVEYKTPSWEPTHWQTVCPYPLCPSYRQFARIISIILIGELLLFIIGEAASYNDIFLFSFKVSLHGLQHMPY